MNKNGLVMNVKDEGKIAEVCSEVNGRVGGDASGGEREEAHSPDGNSEVKRNDGQRGMGVPGNLFTPNGAEPQ